LRLDRFSARAKQAGLTTRTAVVYTKPKALTQGTPVESAKRVGRNDLRTVAHPQGSVRHRPTSRRELPQTTKRPGGPGAHV